MANMEGKFSKTLEDIETMTKKGHEFLQNGAIEDSYLTYEKALTLARETNDAFTIRACLFNLGACCVAKKEAQKGLEFLLRALPPDKYEDGVLNFCDLKYNMAIAYDLLGKPTEAKRCYETALEGYREYSHSEMIAEVCLKLGSTLAALGLLKEAVQVFHDGELVYQQLLDQRHEVLCLSSRATLLAELHDEQSEALLKDVVEKVEQLQNDSLKAKVYSDIGLVYASSAHYDVAAQYLDKALDLLQSKSQTDKKLQASVYQNLGAVHNQLGEYVKAIAYHEKAIQLYGIMSVRYAQGHTFSNLGFAYSQLGELEESQVQFTHALQAAKDCQDFRGQWQAYEGLSAVHFQNKDYKKAVGCLKAALTVLPLGDIKDNSIHERIVAKLSNALEKQLTANINQPVDQEDNSRSMVDTGRVIMVQADTHESNDRSLEDTRESSSKVGHMRPREKNHKFIARGLQVDEPSSDNERSDSSHSTFDTISSYSGNASSLIQEEPQLSEAESEHQGNTASSVLTPPKKDPLNNTYEEPQDVIHVTDAGRLHLHDMPPGAQNGPVPGPHDTVLASVKENPENEQLTAYKRSKKSKICVVQ